MDQGFYRVYGTWYGDYRTDAREAGDYAYVGPVDAGTTETDPSTRKINLGVCLKKVTKKGFRVLLDLEAHNAVQNGLGFNAVLKAARPYWGSVTRVCLADESPDLDYAALALSAREKMTALGLLPRPLGAVFRPDQILNGDARIWAPLDWVGLEGYTEVPTAPKPGLSVRRKLDAMASKIGEGHEFVTIAQSFTRNGTVTSPSVLTAVNKAAWGFSREHPQVGALVAFRWGQTGGIKDLPFLAGWWRERWAELNA